MRICSSSTHNPILRVLAGQKERHREVDRGSAVNREKERDEPAERVEQEVEKRFEWLLQERI